MAKISVLTKPALISICTNGKIRAWDNGAEKLFGYTLNEMSGRHIFTVIPNIPMLENLIEELNNGKRPEVYITTGKSKNQKEFRLSVAMSPVSMLSGNILCVIQNIR